MFLSYYVHQANESNFHSLFECTGSQQSGAATLPFVNIHLFCYWDSNFFINKKKMFLVRICWMASKIFLSFRFVNYISNFIFVSYWAESPTDLPTFSPTTDVPTVLPTQSMNFFCPSWSLLLVLEFVFWQVLSSRLNFSSPFLNKCILQKPVFSRQSLNIFSGPSIFFLLFWTLFFNFFIILNLVSLKWLVHSFYVSVTLHCYLFKAVKQSVRKK